MALHLHRVIPNFGDGEVHVGGVGVVHLPDDWAEGPELAELVMSIEPESSGQAVFRQLASWLLSVEGSAPSFALAVETSDGLFSMAAGAGTARLAADGASDLAGDVDGAWNHRLYARDAHLIIGHRADRTSPRMDFREGMILASGVELAPRSGDNVGSDDKSAMADADEDPGAAGSGLLVAGAVVAGTAGASLAGDVRGDDPLVAAALDADVNAGAGAGADASLLGGDLAETSSGVDFAVPPDADVVGAVSGEDPDERVDLTESADVAGSTRVDAPDFDISNVDTPDTDAPNVDGLVLDTSSVDVPSVEVPSVDVPGVGLLDVDRPDIDLAGVGVEGDLLEVAAPDADAPVLDAPDVDVRVDADGAELLESELPDLEMPDPELSDSVSSIETSESEPTDLGVSAGSQAGVDLPEVDLPEAGLPEADLPEVNLAESSDIAADVSVGVVDADDVIQQAEASISGVINADPADVTIADDDVESGVSADDLQATEAVADLSSPELPDWLSSKSAPHVDVTAPDGYEFDGISEALTGADLVVDGGSYVDGTLGAPSGDDAPFDHAEADTAATESAPTESAADDLPVVDVADEPAPPVANLTDELPSWLVRDSAVAADTAGNAGAGDAPEAVGAGDDRYWEAPDLADDQAEIDSADDLSDGYDRIWHEAATEPDADPGEHDGGAINAPIDLNVARFKRAQAAANDYSEPFEIDTDHAYRDGVPSEGLLADLDDGGDGEPYRDPPTALTSAVSPVDIPDDMVWDYLPNENADTGFAGGDNSGGTSEFEYEPNAPHGEGVYTELDDDLVDEVVGLECSLGHLNSPAWVRCGTCGMDLKGAVPGRGRHPGLGLVMFDDGSTLPINAGYLIGRRPNPEAVGEGSLQALVLNDESQSVSRNHAILQVDGWELLISDCGSSNGTHVEVGADMLRLEPGEPYPLMDGQRVVIGTRWFEFRSAGRP